MDTEWQGPWACTLGHVSLLGLLHTNDDSSLANVALIETGCAQSYSRRCLIFSHINKSIALSCSCALRYSHAIVQHGGTSSKMTSMKTFSRSSAVAIGRPITAFLEHQRCIFTSRGSLAPAFPTYHCRTVRATPGQPALPRICVYGYLAVLCVGGQGPARCRGHLHVSAVAAVERPAAAQHARPQGSQVGAGSISACRQAAPEEQGA